ncbi:hypothetical protein BDV93DRAFT_553172 [Ceratobasidium sp. AG-I]|nr:hypothetical protein BDV93DRAFT_553172 [Ceratobasidium sp. AG-I]
MFALKFALAAFTLQSTIATPTNPVAREDWKIALGWDGKVTTPAQLDPSNAVIALTKRAIGGVYFCTDADFHGNCHQENTPPSVKP